MARLRRAAMALGASLAVALGVGIAPAYADRTSPPATSATPAAPAPPHTGDNGHTLSPQDLRQQIAEADALRADLLQSNAAIAAATERLERLSLQANTLLEEYAAARDAERAAREEANRNVRLFEVLSTQLTEDRRALGEWAYHAYAGGGGTLGEVQALLDVLGKSADEASDTAAQLSYLSDQRTGAYERVRDHAALQRDVAARAVEASSRATEEAAKAAEAKRKLDAVIKDQQAQLEATRQLHAEQVSRVGPVSGLLLGTENAEARAATKRLHQALAQTGFGVDGSTTTCSDDESEYPNGHIPAKALCPLYGSSPGHMLRPSAAAAFNALSEAYERATGSPICVTDSYRSLAEQVAVKAARGKWAASPGTSEHGMGRALDLCGGINSFGTPAHLWMKQHAPLYGWFHPAWAEPGGSLPEPWHWEYAG